MDLYTSPSSTPSLPGVVGWSPAKLAARNNKRWRFSRPTGSIGLIYLPYLHEWLILMVIVGKYTIHGFYGRCILCSNVRFPMKVSVPKL